MQIRPITGSERFESALISMTAFHGRTEDLEKMRSRKEEHPADDWGAFDEDGTLMAHLVCDHYTGNLGDKKVALQGIGAVSTLPEYRHGGGVRGLFDAVLPYSFARGEVLSLLYPFSHAFYRKFGYETAAYRWIFSFEPAMMRPFSCKERVKLWNPGDSIADIERIYAEFSAAYQLAFDRSGEDFCHGMLRGEWWKDRRFVYILGDTPCAYIVFEDVREGRDKIMKVSECAWSTPEGFRLALGFLNRFDRDYSRIILPMPTGLDLRVLALDPGQVDVVPDEFQMVRVVNVQKALECIAPPEASFTLLVSGDAQIAQNNGLWQVNQGAVCKIEGENADLEADIHGLSLLVSGSMGLREALLRGDVRLNGNARTLFDVFRAKPLYVGDHF